MRRKGFNIREVALFVALLTSLTGCVTANYKESLTAADSGLLSFPTESIWRGKAVKGMGTLEFPEGVQGPVPVVIVVHGTAGVGYREQSWGAFFRDQGYASFTLNYFVPRAATSNQRDVPRPPGDVWGALKLLSTHPLIDRDRVGVIGFSNGASVTMGASYYRGPESTGGIEPKAYFMLYGGCSSYLVSQASPPAAYRFFVGEADATVPSAGCRYQETLGEMNGRDVKTFVFPGVYHGYDDNSSRTVQHPRWGTVVMRMDGAATEATRQEVLRTLREVFAAGT